MCLHICSIGLRLKNGLWALLLVIFWPLVFKAVNFVIEQVYKHII